VGLAAGEDIEQAGIAGLTAAGTSAIGSGIGKLAANPGVPGIAGKLTPDQLKIPNIMNNVGELNPNIIPDTIHVGDGTTVDYSNMWKGIEQNNPEMMGIGENIAKHDYYFEPNTGSYTGSPTDAGIKYAAGQSTGPQAAMNLDPSLIPSSGSPTDAGVKYAAGQSTGPQAAMNLDPPNMLDRIDAWKYRTYDPRVEGQEMLGNTPTTSVSEGLGNLADRFSTTDKAIDSAKFLAPQTTLTAGGLYAQKQLGIEDEEAAAEEKRKRGYSQSIWNNYMSQGRMPHPSSSLYKYGFANGGIVGLTNGLGDGTSDSIPAVVDGGHPARLSSNEFVIPADVVSHIGNGSTEAGAQSLYDMMDRLRVARTNSSQQPNDINPRKYLPA
jgi:hypothetical protein